MRTFWFSVVLLLLISSAPAQQEVRREVFTDVQLSKRSFDPSRGDTVQLLYESRKAGKVTLSVYDSDGGLVATLIDAESQDAGAHSVDWSGKDLDGQAVPDEAYTFTLEMDSGEFFDPTTFSGGIVHDITQADFNDDAGTVTYELPEPARVLIRMGLHNGPMYKTLVDWEARVAGSILEYWDGRDEDKLFLLRDQKGFSTLITFVTLPDATVIAFGNEEQTYRDYKLGPAKGRPQKPDRPRSPEPDARLRPVNLVPPAWVRAPHVHMTFPDLDETQGYPRVKDSTNVRVDLDQADQSFLQHQFEIIFFVDNVFFAEAERGYLPFNWEWEVHQLPPGEHVVTANVSSFDGQVGVSSRRVSIVNDDFASSESAPASNPTAVADDPESGLALDESRDAKSLRDSDVGPSVGIQGKTWFAFLLVALLLGVLVWKVGKSRA